MIATDKIVNVTLADLVGSAIEVSVMVTVPPGGVEDGAVYVVFDWLILVARLKVPQSVAWHVAAQATPLP